jgi:DNA-binding YbaB/EbfC family protein
MVTINPFDILKNAQKIQEQMGVVQEQLAEIRVSGSAGGDMVEVDLNGKLEVLEVRISQEIVDERDAAMLSDLVASAFSVAMEKAREAAAAKMAEVAGPLVGSGGLGGLNIPGLSGLGGAPGA